MNYPEVDLSGFTANELEDVDAMLDFILPILVDQADSMPVTIPRIYTAFTGCGIHDTDGSIDKLIDALDRAVLDTIGGPVEEEDSRNEVIYSSADLVDSIGIFAYFMTEAERRRFFFQLYEDGEWSWGAHIRDDHLNEILLKYVSKALTGNRMVFSRTAEQFDAMTDFAGRIFGEWFGEIRNKIKELRDAN